MAGARQGKAIAAAAIIPRRRSLSRVGLSPGMARLDQATRPADRSPGRSLSRSLKRNWRSSSRGRRRRHPTGVVATVATGGDRPATWGHVADRLIALMQRARYPTWGFLFGAWRLRRHPAHRAARPERHGARGTERWATEVKLASTSVLDGIFTVRRPKGIYRAIAFVITTDPRSGGR